MEFSPRNQQLHNDTDVVLWLVVVAFDLSTDPQPTAVSNRQTSISALGEDCPGITCFVFNIRVLGHIRCQPKSVDGDWQLQNPIGFIPNQLIEVSFLLPWLIGLGTFTLLCVASLFVRYRGAAVVERNQIKWLLYAAGVFAVIYIPGLFLGWEESYLFNLLFILAIIMIPVSIAVAILRYRLFDIDILIRKTLVYGGLTVTLALVYFGGVVLLQSLFETISGQQSPIAIVISTLLIAALFNPLRKRIQNAIDQRFYRRKYNAEQALADFAATARSETDLEALTAQVEGFVEKTMQPEQVNLWLKPDAIRWATPSSQDNG